MSTPGSHNTTSSSPTFDINSRNACVFPSHMQKALAILEADFADIHDLGTLEAKQAVLDHVVNHTDLYDNPDGIMLFYYHQGIFPTEVGDPTSLGFSKSGRKLHRWSKEDEELTPFTKALEMIKNETYPMVPPLLRRVHVTEAIMSHSDTLLELEQRIKRLEINHAEVIAQLNTKIQQLESNQSN